VGDPVAGTVNASTVTVTPPCWTTRPGCPLTLRSTIVTSVTLPAMLKAYRASF
jgi:hypothetical protein